MKITTIQTNQASQNTARPLDKSSPAVDKRNSSSVSLINSGDSSVKTETIKTPQVQAQVMTASINNIKEQLDQILVDYPPFFPIGKYQRLDFIQKIKGIQEEFEGLSIEENLKNMIPRKKLPDEATDNEISLALDQLFHLRDKLAKNGSVSSDTPKIGSIMNIKV